MEQLEAELKARFLVAEKEFSDDLDREDFRSGLRVKKLKGRSDVWEITFAPDGRATFVYGDPKVEGRKHVHWRAIGTHHQLGL